MKRSPACFLLWFIINVLFVLTVNAASRPKAKAPLPTHSDTTFTRFLEELIPDGTNWTLSGPLNPMFPGNTEAALVFHAPTIICPDQHALQRAVRLLKDCEEIKIKKLRPDLDKARSSDPAGYRGITVRFEWLGQEKNVQLVTFQQLRWLLWAKDRLNRDSKSETKAARSYAIAISNYLDAIEKRLPVAKVPRAEDFGLHQEYDLYQELPSDEIIISDSLAKITTDFVHEVTAFAPTLSVIESLKQNLTKEIFADTDLASFQWQCREFFEQGKSLSDVRTLSADVFSGLGEGDYAFSVGVDGEIRFAKVADSAIDRWPQLPHGLFFCNQPVLTAGRFSIERHATTRISRVSICSRMLVAGISSAESDRRLKSLGHFFLALDSLGIPYPGIIISKF